MRGLTVNECTLVGGGLIEDDPEFGDDIGDQGDYGGGDFGDPGGGGDLGPAPSTSPPTTSTGPYGPWTVQPAPSVTIGGPNPSGNSTPYNTAPSISGVGLTFTNGNTSITPFVSPDGTGGGVVFKTKF